MNDLEIVDLDPFDRTAFDAWHDVYLRAEHEAGTSVSSPWQLEEMRATMQHPGSSAAQLGWSGLVAGRVVVVGWMRLPLLDNRDRAEVAVHTLPEARRRGYAAAMLRHIEQVARERDRTILVAESAWPYVAGPDGAGEPGPEFAAAQGFALALGDVKRTLRLPLADGVLDALAAEAAPYHDDYPLRSFVGPVPDELLDGWARLVSSLMTEAPMGDLDVEPETADPAVVREREDLLVSQGRTKYNTVALDPAGELVAYTDLATTVHEPGRAFQWGTLVRGDARGHRLGLAVKVANLQQLQRERSDIELLTTFNAEVNAHMIGVNVRLGFEPVGRLGEFQKKLAR